MQRTEIPDKPPLIVICGPTAAGKTALALELATQLDIEVISADSRQVYRGMDIGTAKATAEEQQRLPHHLIDVVEPDDSFTVADFVHSARQTDADIRCRGRLPVVVGGTGLYIQALTSGLAELPGADPAVRRRLHDFADCYGDQTLHALLQECDPQLADQIHFRNRVRIVRALEVFECSGKPLSQWQSEHAFADRPYRVLTVGLCPPRSELFARIDRRVEMMVDSGLVKEVRLLLGRGLSSESKALKTIGYREIIPYIRGEISLVETVGLIQRNTRRYAKRQLTWFRRDESINWFESCAEFAKIVASIVDFVSLKRSGHA